MAGRRVSQKNIIQSITPPYHFPIVEPGAIFSSGKQHMKRENGICQASPRFITLWSISDANIAIVGFCSNGQRSAWASCQALRALKPTEQNLYSV